VPTSRPFDVSITGEWSVDRDLNQLSQDDLREGELKFGLPVAFIVLLLVFGTIVAGLVTVLMAIISIVVALGLTALLGQAFELSIFTGTCSRAWASRSGSTSRPPVSSPAPR
jgi:RND superfamily putative drug exporter